MTAVREPAGRTDVDAFAAVLAGARANEPRAFQSLYSSLAGQVCGYLQSRGASDAEDLTSEVFLRAFRHLDDFDGDQRAYRAWVFTIARRLLIDEYRRSSRQPRQVELPAPMAESLTGGDVESESLISIGAHDVEAILNALPANQRDVLTLRVIGDLTIDEVAGVIGKRRGAVKALQRRALANVRELMAARPVIEENEA